MSVRIREGDEDRERSDLAARQAGSEDARLASLHQHVGNRGMAALLGPKASAPISVQRKEDGGIRDIYPQVGLFEKAVGNDAGKAVAFLPKVVEEVGADVFMALVDKNVLAKALNELPSYDELKATDKSCMDKLATEASDGDTEVLRLLVSKRFGLDLKGVSPGGKGKKSDWTGPELKRAYPVLLALPEGQVSRNKMLEVLGHATFNDPNASGGYYQESGFLWGGKEAVMEFGPGQENKTDTWDVAGTPLAGVNYLDSTIRHEVGHAVDAEIGWSRSQSSDSKRGGWKDYETDHKAVIEDMVNSSRGTIASLYPAERTDDVKKVLRKCLGDGSMSDLHKRLTNLDWWKGQNAEYLKSIENDEIVVALTNGLKEPWYNVDPQTPIGDHVYERSYEPGHWVRYENAARQRLVSKYQWRAPGEWFAECYAAYYRQDGGKKKGEVLASKDPDTKDWFEKNIDSNYEKAKKDQGLKAGGRRTSWS